MLLFVLVACAAASKGGPSSTSSNVIGTSPSAPTALPTASASTSWLVAPSDSAPVELSASAAVMPDVDYWATPQPVVDKMLEVAAIKPTDLVYDLGCGDARSLVTAATRYGARGVGFDIDPRLVARARENARSHGVNHLVTIEQADIFTVDLSPADVIFLYITPRFNLRMVPQFEKMRRGSRIISHEFEIPGAKPTRVTHLRGPLDGPPDADQPGTSMVHTIYLWRLPWQKQWTDWK